jgi:hypothetical protein
MRSIAGNDQVMPSMFENYRFKPAHVKRNRGIIRDLKAGVKARDLALKHSVGPARIRMIATIHKGIEDRRRRGRRDYGLGVLERSIDTLDLGCRAHNALYSILYERTVGNLVQVSAQEILCTPGVGRKSLREIEDALGKLGLALRVTPSP